MVVCMFRHNYPAGSERLPDHRQQHATDHVRCHPTARLVSRPLFPARLHAGIASSVTVTVTISRRDTFSELHGN